MLRIKHLLFLLFFQFGIIIPSQATFNFQAHWEDEFSKKEQEHLKKWIQDVGNAVEKTLGTYPFKTHIYFHRSNATNEPVPWAHTARLNEEAVHFHVNPNFSYTELIEDWTAAHEIAHLSIPYLGQENSWFAEGYASFFQWQIMYNQGVLTIDEVKQKYSKRLASALPKFNSDLTFIEIVEQLQKRRDYSSFYYGGACYFIQMDQRLKANTSFDLAQIIQKFQSNGRLKATSLREVVLQFNQLSNSKHFTDLLYSFRNDPAKKSVGKTKYY